MAKVSTNISLDADLKKNSQQLFQDLGMDLTTAITVFLKQSLRVQGFPFAVTRDIPNAETIEAMNEFGYDMNRLAEKIDEEDWEYLDVTIRCYLLGEVIAKVVEEINAERG